jgi:hypothetical protein
MERVGRPGRFRLGALALAMLAILAGGTLRLSHATGQAPLPTPTPIPPSTSGPIFRLTYPAGWNLIGAPGGAALPMSNRPILTYQGMTGYQTVSSGTATAGYGYWVYLDTLTSVTYQGGGLQTFTRTLPAGQWAMVGNPSSTTMLVSGADVLYVYDPVQGYLPTTVLVPGQGGWAFSYKGGAFTLTNVSP